MKKEDILNEIRRTAIDGKVLGAGTFASKTGILESDWKGVHWARWSDAAREAGVEPNTMQQPHDLVMMIEKYAKLAQRLGSLPTDDELRLERRADSQFPSRSSYPNRLGNKPEIVEKVLEHCRSRQEFGQVVKLCEEYLAKREDNVAAQAKADAPSKEQTGDGCVYLLKGKTEGTTVYKIGQTSAPEQRDRAYKTHTIEQLEVVHVISTDDPVGIEAYWHKRFKSKRVPGKKDRFHLDKSDVKAFKRRKRFM